jgi:hypothetical protein
MTNSNSILLRVVFILQLCFLLIVALWFGGVFPLTNEPKYSAQTDRPNAAANAPRQTVFQHAINIAAENNPQHIVHNLFALNAENTALEWRDKGGVKQVKVVTWMSDDTFKAYYDKKTEYVAPSEHITKIWVTLVPQVKNFCRSLEVENPTFRVQQFLGLDPNRYHQRFMEIWVNPEDLFRPCPDPEPTDNGCQLALDRNNPPTVKGISNYVAFYDSLLRSSYSPAGAPWTRLGYTYDWAYNQFGVGASEYIVSPGSTFFIDGNYSTKEYCSDGN